MEYRTKKYSQTERILRAAEEQFISKGYEATRIDDIRQVAGVSKTAVYSLFGSKRELFLALNNFIVARAISNLMSAIPAVNTSSIDIVKQNLIDLGQDYLKNLLTKESTQLLRLSFSISDKFKSETIKYFSPCSDEFIYLLAKYFEKINDADIFKIPNTERAAQQFSSLMIGSIVYDIIFNQYEKYDDHYIAQHVESSVILFIKGHQQ